jgi:hypothetical protein
MNCRDLDDILLSGARELPAGAEAHLRECAQCRTLREAMGASAPGMDSATLERLHASVPASLPRVRPLAPAGVYALLFAAIWAAVAVAGAAVLGMKALPLLGAGERAAIFTVFAAAASLAALAAARSMRPGAKTPGGIVVSTVAVVAVEAVFFALFDDFHAGRFVRSGIACLSAGLACSAPAGALIWMIVKRGYVVDPLSAGTSIGAAAGMAGLTMLALHCPLKTIPHLAVWHAAVLACAVAAGAAIAAFTQARGRSGRSPRGPRG